MNTFELSGKVRQSVGKKDASLLRKEEKVPCVLYGGDEVVHFYTETKKLKKLIYTPDIFIVNLDIEGKICQCMMQDIQFHAVTDEVLHIDFLKVSNDKLVKVDIPIKVKGFAKGIKQGGKLQLEMRRLKVMGYPQDLPSEIEIDVTELELSQSLRVGDLTSDKITFMNGKSVPVVRIMITRAARAAAQTTKDGKK